MRLRYYLISLGLGFLYFFAYLLILNIHNWSHNANAVIDILYLITTLIFFIGLTWKDINDELHIRRGQHPIGGPQIEHAPFVFSIFAVTIYSIFVFQPSWIIKVILSIACLIEGIWDIDQDLRTHSLR